MKKLIMLIISLIPLITKGQNREWFKNVFTGSWVNASSIRALNKTKSPYKSQNEISYIVELDFDSVLNVTDSLLVGAPSIHESNSFYVYFRRGLMANSVRTSVNYGDSTETEMGYEVAGADTFLYLYHYDIDKKVQAKEKYVRIPKNSEGAFQYMVNSILISGTYTYTDKRGTLQTVRFTKDGKITGFGTYCTYYINTDFVAGPENNVDEIIFNLYANDQKGYGFEIKGNTLCFYNTEENADHSEIKLGKLQYKFTKVKGTSPKK